MDNVKHQLNAKREAAERAMAKISELGYTIYDDGEQSYFHFSDNKNIGFMEVKYAYLSDDNKDLSEKLSASIQYKPSRKNGSGRAVKDLKIESINEEFVVQCLSRGMKPSKGDAEAINWYSSPKEWLEDNFNKENIKVYPPRYYESKIGRERTEADRIQIQLRKEDQGNGLRFFAAGVWDKDGFTGVMHDYVGGGCSEEALVYKDQFLPTQYADEEYVEWDDQVALFNEISRVKYETIDDALDRYTYYDTDMGNYAVENETVKEFGEVPVLVIKENQIAHISEMVNVPYGLGNTSFPDNGYEVKGQKLNFEEFLLKDGNEKRELFKSLPIFADVSGFLNDMDKLRDDIAYLDATVNDKNIMISKHNTYLGIEDKRSGKLLFVVDHGEDRGIKNVEAIDRHLSVPQYEPDIAKEWMMEELVMNDGAGNKVDQGSKGAIYDYGKRLLGKRELAEIVRDRNIDYLNSSERRERMSRGYVPQDMGNAYIVPKELQEEVTEAVKHGDIEIKGMGGIFKDHPNCEVKNDYVYIKQDLVIPKEDIREVVKPNDGEQTIVDKLKKFETIDENTIHKEMAKHKKSEKPNKSIQETVGQKTEHSKTKPKIKG